MEVLAQWGFCWLCRVGLAFTSTLSTPQRALFFNFNSYSGASLAFGDIGDYYVLGFEFPLSYGSEKAIVATMGSCINLLPPSSAYLFQRVCAWYSRNPAQGASFLR